MPSNKNKVSIFLTDDELKALNEFKKKNEVGNTEAVVSLLNKTSVYMETRTEKA